MAVGNDKRVCTYRMPGSGTINRFDWLEIAPTCHHFCNKERIVFAFFLAMPKFSEILGGGRGKFAIVFCRLAS